MIYDFILPIVSNISTKCEDDEFIHDFYHAEGYVEFFVIQNVIKGFSGGKSSLFEIDILDISGCAQALREGLGVEYAIESGELGIGIDELKEGAVYKVFGISVDYIPKKSYWCDDDDEIWSFERIEESKYNFNQFKHKIKILLWRIIGSRMRNTFHSYFRN